MSCMSSDVKSPENIKVIWIDGAWVETDTMAVPAEFGADPSSRALYNSVDKVLYLW